MGDKIYQITDLLSEVCSKASTPNYLVLESISFGDDSSHQGKKSVLML